MTYGMTFSMVEKAHLILITKPDYQVSKPKSEICGVEGAHCLPFPDGLIHILPLYHDDHERMEKYD